MRTTPLSGQMENSLVVYCPILKVGHIPIYSCSILLLLSSKNCKLSHWSCILHFSLCNPLNPIWQRISCENFFSVTLCRRFFNVQLRECCIIAKKIAKFRVVFQSLTKKRDHYPGVVRKVMQPSVNNGLFHHCVPTSPQVPTTVQFFSRTTHNQ